jgi:hypothetical protein
MSRRQFVIYRFFVLATAGTWMVTGGLTVFTLGSLNPASQADNPFNAILVVVERVQATGFGAVSELMFTPFVVAISATALSAHVVAALIGCVAICGVLTGAVFWLYGHAILIVAARERRQYSAQLNIQASMTNVATAAAASDQLMRRLSRLIWLGGSGPVFWRQFLGARRRATSLTVSMVIPAMLALIPTFAPVSNFDVFFSVVAAVAFYSFILLPTALKFDFRRDIDRMTMFKALPVGSLSVACGQLATPAIVATLFQAAVLWAAVVIRPVPPVLFFGAVFFLVLTNILIFALDNLIFLWYPHRPDQEGMEIFLRTTLTFTGKGLLFAAALAIVLAWSYPASKLARLIHQLLDYTVSGYAIFLAGILAMLCAAVVAAVWLLARAYRHFDPSVDGPS